MSDYYQLAQEPPKTPFYQRAWFAAAVAGVVGIAIGATAAGRGESADDAASAPAPTVTVTVEVEGQPATEEPIEEATSEQPTRSPTSEAPPATTNPAFGETFTYEDGLSVTVSAPTPFEPSEFAAGLIDGQSNITFTVTVVNGTANNFEPATIFVTVQSGAREGSQIFDSTSNLMGGPSTALLPGREATFDLGFSVADPADIVLEIVPDFTRDSVIYTS